MASTAGPPEVTTSACGVSRPVLASIVKAAILSSSSRQRYKEFGIFSSPWVPVAANTVAALYNNNGHLAEWPGARQQCHAYAAVGAVSWPVFERVLRVVGLDTNDPKWRKAQFEVDKLWCGPRHPPLLRLRNGRGKTFDEAAAGVLPHFALAGHQ